MMSKDEDACEVRGTLAMVLRFSRFLGVAPLSLVPQEDGYIARVSKTSLVYSWILFGFINGVVFTALYLDVQCLRGECTFRVETRSALIVWLIDLTMLTTTLGLGVWQGAARMQRTLKLLNRIQKVLSCLKRNLKQPCNERSNSFAVVGVIIGTSSLMLFEFTFRYFGSDKQNKKLLILHMYNAHYFKHNMLLLILMQIFFVVLSIRSAFIVINNGLRELYDISKFKTVIIPKYPYTISAVERNNVHNKGVFQAVDIKMVKKCIHELSESYDLMCNEVETFNDDNGPIMFMALGVFTIYLMIASYHMIKAFCKSDSEDAAIVTIILEICFCSYHYLHLFLLIAPCHLTHNEMNKTQILLNKVMYEVTKIGHPILTEIDIFYKKLILYKPTFSPLSMLTLHISHITTVFAAVTTYLTIVIQYRVIEECQ